MMKICDLSVGVCGGIFAACIDKKILFTGCRPVEAAGRSSRNTK